MSATTWSHMVRAAILRVSYLPGYQIVAEEFDGQLCVLRIERSAVDVRDPTRSIQIASRRILTSTAHQNHADIIREIRVGLTRHSEHEIDEWFMVDGVQFRDPHPMVLNKEDGL